MSDSISKEEVIRYCEDPVEYFGASQANMHAISQDELHALQLGAIKHRFDTLVDKIPMLKQLASKQGIDQIDSLEDAVPLLFEHTMYKSYPPVLLEKNRFKDINKFLSRLCTQDLTTIDVSGCQSIDDWMAVLDKETDLAVAHSSGTSGTMSFLPTTKRGWDIQVRGIKSKAVEVSGPIDPGTEIYSVYPYYRTGGSAHLRINDPAVKHIVGEESRFIAAYPLRMSSDVLYMAARIRAAKAKGTLDKLNISDALVERLKEFEEQQKNMADHVGQFFDRIVNDLRGKRVYMNGTWNLLHNLAAQGLEKGEEGVFAPDSVIMTGGGAKGMVPPDNWQDDVCRFMGNKTGIPNAYGMTEVHTSHYECEHGNYHFSPAAIAFVLDAETSEPLPRTGRVTGRAAFFDICSDNRWGGFISGDEITVNWSDECPCGRKSAYIEGAVQRFSEKQGGDDKISCAATENAHKEAMDFLTSF